MSVSKLCCLTTILILSTAAAAGPSGNSLRKSPPLTFTQPSGEETRLYDYRGKVVVMEFLFVRSPHCLELAEMLNKLNHDLGPRGFQPIAIAFGPYADAGVLTHLVEYFKLTYPVGYASSDKVDAFLGREGKEVLKVPQIVVIDRKGIIRASSGSKGDRTLENESSLRALLDPLLQENAPVRSGAK
jgi:cytochrome oxidase Cu insertion factor (SCO1/SenC/PrrC family)